MGKAQKSSRIEKIQRDARKLRVSQVELARRSGLDEMTISRTLAGTTDPLLSTTERLEQALAAIKSELRDHLADPLTGSAA